MQDTIKHTLGTVTSLCGLFGSITLASLNQIVSIGCGSVGFVAGCLTIISLIKKLRK